MLRLGHSISCLIVVALVTTAPLLYADTSNADVDSNGKIVPITINGRQMPVRVEQQTDPLSTVRSSGNTKKYDPLRLFSSSNEMANKSFSPSADPLTKTDADFTDHERTSFVTKPYAAESSNSTVQNFNTKASFPTFTVNNSKSTGFDKSFVTARADTGENPSALPSLNAAEEQSRTALLGTPASPIDVKDSSMAHEQYLGPGAQHVPDGVEIPGNEVLTRMSGVPDRQLSIDEVRDLINHDAKPDYKSKPAKPSKPLNDPDYQPEPLRVSPAESATPDNSPTPAIPAMPALPAASADDDKNDPVPSPGTMAAQQPPENSEPLPQP